jgi:hypothetical protein
MPTAGTREGLPMTRASTGFLHGHPTVITSPSHRNDDNWDIYKMNAAGGLEMNLTNNPAMEDANDARPSWSSDATSIVFAATGHPRYSGFLRRALGIASILVQSALQMGLVLLAVMRWDLRSLASPWSSG